MHLIRFHLRATRSFWLLAYLFSVQVAIGNVVLCFERDGGIAIEAGECPCRDHRASSVDGLAAIDVHFADSCRDLAIGTDSQFYPQDRQGLDYWAIESVHPFDQEKRLLSPIRNSNAHRNYTVPDLPPSAYTAVLLI
jgi:hypothetical protein